MTLLSRPILVGVAALVAAAGGGAAMALQPHHPVSAPVVGASPSPVAIARAAVPVAATPTPVAATAVAAATPTPDPVALPPGALIANPVVYSRTYLPSPNGTFYVQSRLADCPSGTDLVLLELKNGTGVQVWRGKWSFIGRIPYQLDPAARYSVKIDLGSAQSCSGTVALSD